MNIFSQKPQHLIICKVQFDLLLQHLRTQGIAEVNLPELFKNKVKELITETMDTNVSSAMRTAYTYWGISNLENRLKMSSTKYSRTYVTELSLKYLLEYSLSLVWENQWENATIFLTVVCDPKVFLAKETIYNFLPIQYCTQCLVPSTWH